MSYATNSDFLVRYDARLVGDLVRDDGSREYQGDLSSDTTLTAMLSDASAEIDANLFVGDRYTPAELTALSDTSLSYLKRLNCDIALILLKRRRGRFDEKNDGALDKSNQARLEALRKGEVYLMQQMETEAQASTLELDAPAIIPVLRRQTIRNRTRNYYPNPVVPPQSFPN